MALKHFKLVTGQFLYKQSSHSVNYFMMYTQYNIHGIAIINNLPVKNTIQTDLLAAGVRKKTASQLISRDRQEIFVFLSGTFHINQPGNSAVV